ncbi:MAG: glutathione S-transferase family protein, partial [Nannocystis sp.]|nr:glutathione S-transferase family protein [Nannocystis sp.]
MIERELEGREYIAGSTFSLADIGFMPYVEYLFVSGEGSLITDHRNTASWWTRVS